MKEKRKASQRVKSKRDNDDRIKSNFISATLMVDRCILKPYLILYAELQCLISLRKAM